MSIWHMENGAFLEEYDSMDTVISMGIPTDNLYYVASDKNGFEVTSVISWSTPLI
ncbi:hypothetical protein [Sphaerochaeta globosa]|uniref:Uncharacterized protein n=1 Tax=Sphaerochaeta globosa (strain ATCC BAA-1886 / DSM 22777 / Buddy) TaxID=158189 RepID=F0RWP2_SPHGB|nr:hypothetical protein [Sphaerochaeta globosa]ADY13673.1 hypothetical protein SpiBuddy_1849 [Sphaerochaeta globosa str. Buddy]